MTLKNIQKLYQTKKLDEKLDEKGAGGYWDLAGEIADDLIGFTTANGFSEEAIMREQLQTGFYQVFQKVLAKKEYYD